MATADIEEPSWNRCCGRREVLLGAGVIGAGVVGLTGCGGGGDTAELTNGTVKKADIPVGGGRIFKDAKLVVTQPSEGVFKAFSAVCPHQGCLVDTVKDGVISCPCHHSAFDAASGDVKSGPAPKGLDTRSLSESGDDLTIG